LPHAVPDVRAAVDRDRRVPRRRVPPAGQARTSMIKPIRRIVTGHDAKGRSIFVSDGPSPHVLTLPGRGDFALTNLWVTDRAPASNAGNADAAARPIVLEPPANGSIFRVVEFPPEKSAGGFDRGAAFKAMGADH